MQPQLFRALLFQVRSRETRKASSHSTRSVTCLYKTIEHLATQIFDKIIILYFFIYLLPDYRTHMHVLRLAVMSAQHFSMVDPMLVLLFVPRSVIISNLRYRLKILLQISRSSASIYANGDYCRQVYPVFQPIFSDVILRSDLWTAHIIIRNQ